MVEGLARIISGLPHADAASAAHDLGTPILERLQQLLPQASGALLQTPLQQHAVICIMPLLNAETENAASPRWEAAVSEGLRSSCRAGMDATTPSFISFLMARTTHASL